MNFVGTVPVINRLTKPGRRLTKKILIIQIIFVLLSALASFFYWGWYAAYAALAGGIICIVPSSIFAYKAFQFAGAKSSSKVVDSFFMGEKLKLILTVVLFAIVFKFMQTIIVQQWLAFFGTYCMAVIISLLTPLFLNFNHWDK